jgi:hypothetical protein
MLDQPPALPYAFGRVGSLVGFGGRCCGIRCDAGSGPGVIQAGPSVEDIGDERTRRDQLRRDPSEIVDPRALGKAPCLPRLPECAQRPFDRVSRSKQTHLGERASTLLVPALDPATVLSSIEASGIPAVSAKDAPTDIPDRRARRTTTSVPSRSFLPINENGERTMTRTDAWIAAAFTGMTLGAVACASGTAAAHDTNSVAVMAKHACKGQNACKGQGGCRTDTHGCKGQNACKGQGGCHA